MELKAEGDLTIAPGVVISANGGDGRRTVINGIMVRVVPVVHLNFLVEIFIIKVYCKYLVAIEVRVAGELLWLLKILLIRA